MLSNEDNSALDIGDAPNLPLKGRKEPHSRARGVISTC
jgi:hypothetical protein